MFSDSLHVFPFCVFVPRQGNVSDHALLYDFPSSSYALLLLKLCNHCAKYPVYVKQIYVCNTKAFFFFVKKNQVSQKCPVTAERYFSILRGHLVPHCRKYSIVCCFVHNNAPHLVTNLMKKFHFGYFLRRSIIYKVVLWP